jgi:hypothetical protein
MEVLSLDGGGGIDPLSSVDEDDSFCCFCFPALYLCSIAEPSANAAGDPSSKLLLDSSKKLSNNVEAFVLATLGENEEKNEVPVAERSSRPLLAINICAAKVIATR